jgi:hypothetical protein
VLGALVALGTAAPAVRADVAPTRADALFKEGRDRLRRGEIAKACDAFAESQRLDPAIGTLLNLAACHEKQGKTATAWAEYKDVATQAQRAMQAEREKFARQRVAELAARLSILVVTVERTDTDFRVVLDGRDLTKAMLGAEIPVDPGEHTLEVYEGSAQREVDHVHVDLGPARVERVLLRRATAPLPPMAAPSASSPETTNPAQPLPTSAPPPSIAAPPPVASSAPPLPDAAPPHSRSTTWGYIGVATAVVGVGVGSYFGIRAIDEKNAGDGLCRGTVCTADGLAHHDAARTDAWISTSAFAFAVVGAGIALYSFSSPSTEVHAAPVVSRDFVGFAAAKRW